MYTFTTRKDFEQISNTEYTNLCLDDIHSYFSDYTEKEIIRIFGKTIYATYTKTLLEESKIATKQPEQIKQPEQVKQPEPNVNDPVCQAIDNYVKKCESILNNLDINELGKKIVEYEESVRTYLKNINQSKSKDNIHEYVYSFIYKYPEYFNCTLTGKNPEEITAYDWINLSNALKVASDNNSLSSMQDIQKLFDVHILSSELQKIFLQHIIQNYPDIFTSKQKETTTQTTYQICNNSHTKGRRTPIKNKPLAIGLNHIKEIQKIRNAILRGVMVEYRDLSFNSIRDIQIKYISSIKEIFEEWAMSIKNDWEMMHYADAAYYLHEQTKYDEFLLIHFVCKNMQIYFDSQTFYNHEMSGVQKNNDNINTILNKLATCPIDDYFVEEFKKIYVECLKYKETNMFK